MKYGSFHFLSILQPAPAPPCPELDFTFSEAFSKCISSAHTKNLHICAPQVTSLWKDTILPPATQCCLIALDHAFLSVCMEFSTKSLCGAPEIPEQSYPILRSRGKAYQTVNEWGSGKGGGVWSHGQSTTPVRPAKPRCFGLTALNVKKFHVCTLRFHNYLGTIWTAVQFSVQFSWFLALGTTRLNGHGGNAWSCFYADSTPTYTYSPTLSTTSTRWDREDCFLVVILKITRIWKFGSCKN